MTQIREMSIADGNYSFENRDVFLSRFQSLLEQVVEYQCTDVMDRAAKLFSLEHSQLILKMQNARDGLPGAQKEYEEAEARFTKLTQKHPVEWQALQTHDTYMDVFFSGIRQGFASLQELRMLEQTAEQKYRETHK